MTAESKPEPPPQRTRDMLVYTVVVTHNATRWIDKCLNSLERSSVRTNILIIDNKSSDDTRHQIRMRFSTVELIETDSNRGFGCANNIGLCKALSQNADFVFLLNQDAAVECDTIENLINAQQESGYDVISPLHFNGRGTALDTGFANCLKESLTCESISDILQGKTKRIYPTKYVNAAAWLLTNNCIRKVGGFDPSFFMYGEDDNYLMRVRYHDLQVGICFKARIYHDRADRNDSRWEGLYKTKNLAMLYLKDINKSEFALLKSFLCIQVKILLKDILALNLGHLVIQFRTNYYLGLNIRKIRKARKLAKANCAFLHNSTQANKQSNLIHSSSYTSSSKLKKE